MANYVILSLYTLLFRVPFAAINLIRRQRELNIKHKLWAKQNGLLFDWKNR